MLIVFGIREQITTKFTTCLIAPSAHNFLIFVSKLANYRYPSCSAKYLFTTITRELRQFVKSLRLKFKQPSVNLDKDK